MGCLALLMRRRNIKKDKKKGKEMPEIIVVTNRSGTILYIVTNEGDLITLLPSCSYKLFGIGEIQIFLEEVNSRVRKEIQGSNLNIKNETGRSIIVTITYKGSGGITSYEIENSYSKSFDKLKEVQIEVL